MPSCPNCDSTWPHLVKEEMSRDDWHCRKCDQWYPDEELETPEQIKARHKIASDLAGMLCFPKKIEGR